MDADLQVAYDLIMNAVRAEDVYGIPPAALRSTTTAAWFTDANERLMAVVNPRSYTDPNDKAAAWDARERLRMFAEKARLRLADGTYGVARSASSDRSTRTITTGLRAYRLGDVIAQGDFTTVYAGECVSGDDDAGQVVLKVADDPADNDLIYNEAEALTRLHRGGGAQRKHLPVLLDRFTADGNRAGLVLRAFIGCHDLVAVRKRYLNGVPERHAVWMLARMLSAAGYAHNEGVLHTTICPEHVFVHAPSHNIMLIDWTGAVIDPIQTGDVFKTTNERFSAPEVAGKGIPTPGADVYSIGMCGAYVLGGDPGTGEIPETVPDALRAFIGALLHEDPCRRPQDAWVLYHELEEIRRVLWGPKKYEELPM